MAYADLPAVKGRAGRLSSAWGEHTKPSNTDITGFLTDVAAEIDGLISGRGLSPPEAGSAGALALRGLNADGALLLALEATFPESEGPAAAEDEIRRVRKRYEKGWDALVEGKHAAVTLLESTGAGPSASSAWTGRSAEIEPELAPAWRRGQTL